MQLIELQSRISDHVIRTLWFHSGGTEAASTDKADRPLTCHAGFLQSLFQRGRITGTLGLQGALIPGRALESMKRD